uniref:Uncharacterized protein n=1 Tax=Anguilla anguilla TaxID=7936 RepID=A0A0E9TKQ9_ANGAN
MFGGPSLSHPDQQVAAEGKGSKRDRNLGVSICLHSTHQKPTPVVERAASKQVLMHLFFFSSPVPLRRLNMQTFQGSSDVKSSLSRHEITPMCGPEH